MSARSCTENGRLSLHSGPFHKSTEKKERKKEKSAYTTAPCVKVKRMPLTAGLGPSDPLPLKRSSHTDGKGLS